MISTSDIVMSIMNAGKPVKTFGHEDQPKRRHMLASRTHATSLLILEDLPLPTEVYFLVLDLECLHFKDGLPHIATDDTGIEPWRHSLLRDLSKVRGGPEILPLYGYYHKVLGYYLGSLEMKPPGSRLSVLRDLIEGA